MLASETTQSINALYSKDGSTLVAYPNIDTQEIYLSYDDGDSWYPKVFSLSNVIINSVNVSNDGSDISISVSNNAVIFNSKDYGANWTSQYVPSYSQNAVLDMNTTHNSYKFALNKFNNQFSINVNHCPTEN
jgi:photosystem II stability/assembly factor-like uncharacterized protein